MILIVFLVSGVALVGLVLVSNHYTQFCIRNIVGRKMEWLEFIQDTSMVPLDWRIRHERAIAKLDPGSAKLQKRKDTARADYLKRLGKLTGFVKVCTLIPTDAERKQVLRDLDEIKKDWRENDHAVFTPPRSERNG